VAEWQADGALLELLQIASEHQGDAAIDSLAGLSLNSDSSATHSTSQHSPSQPAAQPGAPADSSIKAATAPGMVSYAPPRSAIFFATFPSPNLLSAS